MDRLLLTLQLPKDIQAKLASFCFGLPNVTWVEEGDFHFVLRHFGPLNESIQADIKECLQSIYFLPFSIILSSCGHFHSRGLRGNIWVGVEENSQLLELKKEIDRCLKNIPLQKEESFHSRIIIGYYEHINLQKLGDYLTGLSYYQSEPIRIDQCALLRSRSSPKRMIYEEIEHYKASTKHFGED